MKKATIYELYIVLEDDNIQNIIVWMSNFGYVKVDKEFFLQKLSNMHYANFEYEISASGNTISVESL